MNRIFIFGKGFIGSRLQQEFNCNISGKKINSYQDADREIRRFKPAVIINCIGHIGRNVDECEKNIDKTLTANTFIPIILAEAALRNNIRFVHISSGCIYHYGYPKDSPIDEAKTPDFFELFYSRSKIYSEQALAVLAKRFPVLIVRPRIPLDNRPHPRNILTKIIRYKKVIDLPNSVTYLPDFIAALKHLIRIKARGVYNIVNRGGLRYPELLEEYKKYTPNFKYKVIDFKQLNLLRTNLLLSTRKLQGCGFKIRDIHEVIKECVRDYVNYS